MYFICLRWHPLLLHTIYPSYAARNFKDLSFRHYPKNNSRLYKLDYLSMFEWYIYSVTAFDHYKLMIIFLLFEKSLPHSIQLSIIFCKQIPHISVLPQPASSICPCSLFYSWILENYGVETCVVFHAAFRDRKNPQLVQLSARRVYTLTYVQVYTLCMASPSFCIHDLQCHY